MHNGKKFWNGGWLRGGQTVRESGQRDFIKKTFSSEFSKLDDKILTEKF